MRRTPPPNGAHPVSTPGSIAMRWLRISASIVAMTGVLASIGGVGSVDRLFYDTILAADAQHAGDSVAVIGVDDASLAALGPWPWPRGLYAMAINRLAAANVRAIALDVPFSSGNPRTADGPPTGELARSLAESSPDVIKGGEVALAEAVRKQGRVAVARGPDGLWADLLDSGAVAARSGFVADRDGIVRRVTLSSDDPSVPSGPESRHLMDALVRLAHAPQIGRSLLDGRAPQVVRIPFYGQISHQAYFSFADLVRGEVPSAGLRDKIVIIASASPQISTTWHTPVVPGWAASPPRYLAQLDGALAATLLSDTGITDLPANASVAISTGIVIIAALLLLLTEGWGALPSWVMGAVTIGVSAVLLRSYAMWFAPGATLIGIALLYPLWRWRRLESSMVELSMIFDGIMREPSLLHEPYKEERTRFRHALMRGQIDSALAIAARVKALKRLIATSFEELPYATLLTSADGHVVLANRQSRSYFAALSQTQIDGAQLPYLLSILTPSDARQDFSWWNLIDPGYRQSRLSAYDTLGRDVDITCTSTPGADGNVIGWLVTLADISAVSMADRGRDEALRFITHDMGAQQNLILAELLTIVGADNQDAIVLASVDRVGQHARRSLQLAERFVQLSLAQSKEFDFAVCDLCELMDAAIEENQEASTRLEVLVRFERPDHSVFAEVDSAVLLSAFVNLINNALRFSRAQGIVVVQMDMISEAGEVTISIIDQGIGIAPHEQARLLRVLQGISLPGAVHSSGVGLGLSLAQVVAEKHRGRLEFTSSPGFGTEFRLILPRGLDLTSTHGGGIGSTPL